MQKINRLGKLAILLVVLSSVSTFAFAEASRAMECKEIIAPTASELAKKLTDMPEAIPQVKGVYFDTQTGQHTLIYCKWK